jgi:hypothetical protein
LAFIEFEGKEANILFYIIGLRIEATYCMKRIRLCSLDSLSSEKFNVNMGSLARATFPSNVSLSSPFLRTSFLVTFHIFLHFEKLYYLAKFTNEIHESCEILMSPKRNCTKAICLEIGKIWKANFEILV